ncbi:MAG: hypothetical protein ABSH56_07345 [Bryobacteraceae bacterium]
MELPHPSIRRKDCRGFCLGTRSLLFHIAQYLFLNVSDVVGVFQNAAIGVPMSQVTLTLTTASGAATTCNPVSTCSSSNSAWSTMWPDALNQDNAVGQPIGIHADYTFSSAMALVMPAGTGAFDFPGDSQQTILF